MAIERFGGGGHGGKNIGRPMRRAIGTILYVASLLFTGAVCTASAAQTPGVEPHTDDSLTQSVYERIFDARADFFADIRVDIIGAEALLTGRVTSVQDKARATALVRSVPGIQTVTNVVEVGVKADMHHMADDLLLENRIRKAMRDAFGAKLPRASWRALDGTVYVFGQAASEWEHNRALAIVKQTKGVAKVVDFLRITSGG